MTFKQTSKGRVIYRAADLLEGPLRPVLRRRNPLFKAAGLPEAVLWDGAHLPSWSWTHPRKYVPHAELIRLDVNAAYLAAASNANFAHGGHDHTGPGIDVNPKAAGYYLTTVHPWQVDNIVNPLGTADLPIGSQVWVAAPTAVLLAEMTEAGYWPGVDVHDSYTTDVTCRLRTWTDHIKADRAAALSDLRFDPQDAEAQERYEAIKDGYAIAVQMLRTPHGPEKKNRYYRPDWYDTIHAAHAANTWRKAWKASLMGNSAAAMGATDELSFTPDDLAECMRVAKPPFVVDESGVRLGALKVKQERYVVPAADAVVPAQRTEAE